MAHRFKRHYTVDEARALLPLVREWLQRLTSFREALARHEGPMERLLAAGHEVGGKPVVGWLTAFAGINGVLKEFQRREIQIKDPDRGLIDFPAFHQGREVFLCWEQGEEDIEFWHELDTGYGGRERI
jgi:hypothetical protein